MKLEEYNKKIEVLVEEAVNQDKETLKEFINMVIGDTIKWYGSTIVLWFLLAISLIGNIIQFIL